MVPENPQEWQVFILQELMNRLPEVQPFVESFEVLANNNKGDALLYVSLRGNRAFIPSVIREWSLEPMDTIVYQKGSDIKTLYLSVGNINKLQGTASIGQNIVGQGNMGSPIGLMADPGGGTGIAGRENPFSGFGYNMLTKVASDYFQSKLATAGLAEELLPKKEASERVPSFVMITKAANEYQVYSAGLDNPEKISYEDIKSFFRSSTDPDIHEKYAALTNLGRTFFGDIVSRKNNVTLEPTEDRKLSQDTGVAMPAEEGLYMHDGDPVFISPKLKYLDGTPSQYGLAVKPGRFSVALEFRGFRQNTGTDASTGSKDELVYEPKALVPGRYYFIKDERTKEVTIPFELISCMRDHTNNDDITLVVRPLMGFDSRITIVFSSVRGCLQTSPTSFVYPKYTSAVLSLPKEYDRKVYTPTEVGQDYKTIKVTLYAGGDGFDIIEQGRSLGYMNESKMVFTLINRYGFDIAQAEGIVEKAKHEIQKSFSVKNILSETDVVAKINEEPLNGIQKEALDKVASMVISINALEKCAAENADKIDLLTSILSEDLTKLGAIPVDNQNANTSDQGQQRAITNNTNMAPSAAMGGQNGVYQAMMTGNPQSQSSKQVGDMLTYFYKGDLKPDEYVRILSKLKMTLEDVENQVGKVLLLALFDKVPGQNYEDVRMLMSTINNFSQNVESSLLSLGIA